jgi:ferredoxin
MLRNLIFLNKTINNISIETSIYTHKCVNFLSKYDFCDKCVNICHKNAINKDKYAKKIAINHRLCTNCGLCTTICPTGVFECKYYKYIDLLNSINEHANYYNTINLICEKHLQQSTTTKLTEVIKIPCIGILDYSLLVHIFLYSPKHITIYSNCGKCENNKSYKFFHILLNEIIDFLCYFNYKCPNIEFNDTLTPEKNINKNLGPRKNPSYLSRRELFQYYKKQLVSTTKNSLTLLKDETNTTKKIKKTQKNIPINRKIFLRDIKMLASTQNNILIDKNFSFLRNLRIDVAQCNLCSLCYVFCPTGALIEKSEKDSKGIFRKAGVTIIPEKCVNCDFCINICPAKAINYDSLIEVKNFFYKPID